MTPEAVRLLEVKRRIVAQTLIDNWYRLARWDNPEAARNAVRGVAYEVVKALGPTWDDQ